MSWVRIFLDVWHLSSGFNEKKTTPFPVQWMMLSRFEFELLLNSCKSCMYLLLHYNSKFSNSCQKFSLWRQTQMKWSGVINFPFWTLNKISLVCTKKRFLSLFPKETLIENLVYFSIFYAVAITIFYNISDMSAGYLNVWLVQNASLIKYQELKILETGIFVLLFYS